MGFLKKLKGCLARKNAKWAIAILALFWILFPTLDATDLIALGFIAFFGVLAYFLVLVILVFALLYLFFFDKALNKCVNGG